MAGLIAHPNDSQAHMLTNACSTVLRISLKPKGGVLNVWIYTYIYIYIYIYYDGDIIQQYHTLLVTILNANTYSSAVAEVEHKSEKRAI